MRALGTHFLSILVLKYGILYVVIDQLREVDDGSSHYATNTHSLRILYS